MCLILLALQVHPDYPVVLAANRDEFHDRPTEPLHWWPDADVLAGRDREMGGTWLGVTRGGRFAAITNVREGGRPRVGRRSRGLLVSDCLLADMPPESALAVIGQDYDGYNLLAGRLGLAPEIHWHSNRAAGGLLRLPAGFHGLSNDRLATPWPKLTGGIAGLRGALGVNPPDPEALFAVLADTARAADHELPDTGVPLEWERRLSARFILSPDYGTRSSTLLIVDRHGGVRMTERSYGPEGPRIFDERRFTFSLAGAPVSGPSAPAGN